MSELKINPGSWRKVHQEITGEDPYRWSTILGVVIEDQFVPIAQFGMAWSQDWNKKQPQYEAIADLIAAAPEMYEALESVCVSCQLRDHETDCENCRYGKVLRKARGEARCREVSE